MPKKKLDKTMTELEAFFENVFVCNNKKLQPFVEILNQEPENISQQNLGTLIGVFKIDDESEDSSYIVNYLISVIKKEYFSKTKRGPIESFEAALHKANLALSKLAEHGNVNWIGKLNALCAVIEKNNLHFSQAGNASALLLRTKGLTDISEGLAPNLEPHPLKTFVNVSSGRLEKDDKLILATKEIFDIFSLDEIKKSALRFSNEDFIRFLKTALGNELESAAVLVADIKEKAIEEEVFVPARREETINAFSQKTFAKKNQKKQPALRAETTPELKSALHQANEVTKKNNGHIYIKEDINEAPQKNIEWDYYASVAKDSLKNSGRKITNSVKKITAVGMKKLSVTKLSVAEEDDSEEEIQPRQQPEIRLKPKKDALILKQRINPDLSILEKINARSEAPAKPTLKVLPDFSKIKGTLGRLSYEQKIYALLIVIAIFVVPYFIVKIENNIAAKKEASMQTPTAPVRPLAQDTDVIQKNLTDVYSGSDILQTVNLNGKIFIITRLGIVDPAANKSFPFPNDFGNVKLITGMDSLNLIFLMDNNNKLISFSPVPDAFQDNSIALPANSDIAAADTFLTYLYLFDSQNNQIYRYPRVTSGFGSPFDWLKGQTSLANLKGATVSDNIFITDGQTITKLFRGTKQNFAISPTATPIVPNNIFADQNSGNLYILDKTNSRVVKTDSNGNIIAQYYNPAIGSANNLTVDEKSGNIYLTGNDFVKAIGMNENH